MLEIENFFVLLSNEKNYSQHTIISYRNDIEQFLSFIQKELFLSINAENLESLKSKDFLAWLSNRKLNNYCNKSNARALSAIKSLFKFLQKKYSIFNPIISKIKSPKVEKSLPRTVSLNNFLKIIEEIKTFTKEDWEIDRDIALITLLYGCGLRISEALNIKENDFIADNLLKVLGKRKKERIVPLLPITIECLNIYKKKCPYKHLFSKYIFISKTGKKYNARNIQKIIETVRRILGLPDNITPHAFRHAFASDLLNAGADLRSIQELLGHQNISSTEIYTHLNHKHIVDVYNKSLEKCKVFNKNL